MTTIETLQEAARIGTGECLHGHFFNSISNPSCSEFVKMIEAAEGCHAAGGDFFDAMRAAALALDNLRHGE